MLLRGVAQSLEEFVATAFAEVGLNWRDHVDYDSSLVRSSKIMCSLGALVEHYLIVPAGRLDHATKNNDPVRRSTRSIPRWEAGLQRNNQYIPDG